MGAVEREGARQFRALLGVEVENCPAQGIRATGGPQGSSHGAITAVLLTPELVPYLRSCLTGPGRWWGKARVRGAQILSC